jgi:heme exporter protein CcmD
VSPLLAIAPALPLGKAGKYVAAAYIVVFVVILIYVGIMALRAQRTQRELDQLRRDVEAVKAARDELEHDDDLDESERAGRGRTEQIA